MTSSAGPRGRIAIGAVLAAVFVVGFAMAAWLPDERPGVVLSVVAQLLLLLVPALLLTAALAVSLGEKAPLPNAVVSGVFGGWLMALMFVLGIFSPFALELGGRDLIEFGGDIYWYNHLIVALVYTGAGGAVVGAVCGVAAWTLRFALGQKQQLRHM